MYDDYKFEKRGLLKYFDLAGTVFDLPIAEIIDKRHDGILFFSKISVNTVIFTLKENNIDVILDPLQISFLDRQTGKQKFVWSVKQFKKTEKHGIDINDKDLQNIHMRAIVYKWMDKERIEPFEIIDLGPFVSIKNADSIIFDKNYIDEYIIKMIEIDKKNRDIRKRAKLMEMDKKEASKKLKILRKMLPRNTKEKIKNYTGIKNNMKFFNN